MPKSKKFEAPDWIKKQLDGNGEKTYRDWLKRKAAAHLKRDKARNITNATLSQYKIAIHKAVIKSDGLDAYTGKKLNWSLICKWNNEDSQKSSREYKKKFANLPTVDHVNSNTHYRNPKFSISSWRTNDSKHDQTLREFITLCKNVLQHNGYSVTKIK
jgi:hypothetical protein